MSEETIRLYCCTCHKTTVHVCSECVQQQVVEELDKTLRVMGYRKCCGCGVHLSQDFLPPGPPEPPPHSCGALECDKERDRRIIKMVG